MSSQEEPIGGNPPAYGDLFRGKAQHWPIGHLGRPPEPKLSGIATAQVSSVVQVLGKGKAESDECPKIQALRVRLKQKYDGLPSSVVSLCSCCQFVDHTVRPEYD